MEVVYDPNVGQYGNSNTNLGTGSTSDPGSVSNAKKYADLSKKYSEDSKHGADVSQDAAADSQAARDQSNSILSQNLGIKIDVTNSRNAAQVAASASETKAVEAKVDADRSKVEADRSKAEADRSQTIADSLGTGVQDAKAAAVRAETAANESEGYASQAHANSTAAGQSAINAKNHADRAEAAVSTITTEVQDAKDASNTAKASAAKSKESADNAEVSEAAAKIFRDGAASHAASANTSKLAAQTAAEGAEDSETLSRQFANTASVEAQRSRASAYASEASAIRSEAVETRLEGVIVDVGRVEEYTHRAETAASASETSAGKAKLSETNAATSATTSANEASKAITAADRAETAVSQTDLDTEQSAENASKAKAEADKAAASATAAAMSESNAADSALLSKSSADNAKTSEVSASASASSATASAAAASVSEVNSATSASESAASATASSTSAQQSEGFASAAESSALGAKTSELSAKDSETSAFQSAASASASEADANASEIAASNSATDAATSASESAASALESSNSAVTASTAAQESGDYATAADSSATAARASELASKASETNAATSASEAKSYSDSAQTSANVAELASRGTYKDAGLYDPSTGTLPAPLAYFDGGVWKEYTSVWYCSNSGTAGGLTFQVGDFLLYSPGTLEGGSGYGYSKVSASASGSGGDITLTARTGSNSDGLYYDFSDLLTPGLKASVLKIKERVESGVTLNEIVVGSDEDGGTSLPLVLAAPDKNSLLVRSKNSDGSWSTKTLVDFVGGGGGGSAPTIPTKEELKIKRGLLFEDSPGSGFTDLGYGLSDEDSVLFRGLTHRAISGGFNLSPNYNKHQKYNILGLGVSFLPGRTGVSVNVRQSGPSVNELYNIATKTTTTYGTSSEALTAYESMAEEEKVVTKRCSARSDLMFLECWAEEVKSHIFLNSVVNVSFEDYNFSEFNPITPPDIFTDDYFKQNPDDTIVDKASVCDISQLDSATLNKLLSMEHLSFFTDEDNGGALMQFRFRVRVVRGFGEKTPFMSTLFSEDKYIPVRGSLTTPLPEYTSKSGDLPIFYDSFWQSVIMGSSFDTTDGSVYCGVSDPSGYQNVPPNTGGESWIYPMFIINKLNDKAYHPLLNPFGAHYYSNRRKFDYRLNAGFTSLKDVVDNTYTASAPSASRNGRDDGLSYNVTQPEGISGLVDLRHPFKGFSDEEFLRGSTSDLFKTKPRGGGFLDKTFASEISKTETVPNEGGVDFTNIFVRRLNVPEKFKEGENAWDREKKVYVKKVYLVRSGGEALDISIDEKVSLFLDPSNALDVGIPVDTAKLGGVTISDSDFIVVTIKSDIYVEGSYYTTSISLSTLTGVQGLEPGWFVVGGFVPNPQGGGITSVDMPPRDRANKIIQKTGTAQWSSWKSLDVNGFGETTFTPPTNSISYSLIKYQTDQPIIEPYSWDEGFFNNRAIKTVSGVSRLGFTGGAPWNNYSSLFFTSMNKGSTTLDVGDYSLSDYRVHPLFSTSFKSGAEFDLSKVIINFNGGVEGSPVNAEFPVDRSSSIGDVAVCIIPFTVNGLSVQNPDRITAELIYPLYVCRKFTYDTSVGNYGGFNGQVIGSSDTVDDNGHDYEDYFLMGTRPLFWAKNQREVQ